MTKGDTEMAQKVREGEGKEQLLQHFTGPTVPFYATPPLFSGKISPDLFSVS